MRHLVRMLLAVLACALLTHASAVAQVEPGDRETLTAVTHDVCPRQVAMLGESATHGDGHTVAFKVALVERLVDECGFDSVFFEASHIEFLHLDRQLRTGQAFSADQIFSAVGGLWKFDREFQPLVPFLLAKAKAGQIALGGIDDQLGQSGQDYANLDMVTELTAFLPPRRRQDCTAALHHRIYSDYTEAAPYTEADRSQITACLTGIQIAIAADKTTDPAGREERLEMIASNQRWISRDFRSEGEQIAARDQSMFQNFQWLRRHQPRRHKVIVWAATVHIAKQGDPAWGDRTGTNFGSYVHREYGADAFSLGFSALTGSYRQGRSDVHELPAPPPDALETKTFFENIADSVYVGPAQLQAKGTLPGAIFRHAYQSLPWANFLDGVVVFRKERPPESTR